MLSITYRAAGSEDSVKLAELINMASGGLVEHLFHDLAPQVSSVEILAYGLQSDGRPHSYTNAIVAETEGEVVGMALSYSSDLHGITDEMRKFIPGVRLEHIQDFYAARVENSWYLDAIAVNPEFRGKGIGTELIGLVKAIGWDKGYRTLSLITFADNEPAMRVYRSIGFETVRHVEVLPNQFIDHEGGCLLLKCDIASSHERRLKR